jgi:hypothetical protein
MKDKCGFFLLQRAIFYSTTFDLTNVLSFSQNLLLLIILEAYVKVASVPATTLCDRSLFVTDGGEMKDWRVGLILITKLLIKYSMKVYNFYKLQIEDTHA